jgi:hypothetical protein
MIYIELRLTARLKPCVDRECGHHHPSADVYNPTASVVGEEKNKKRAPRCFIIRYSTN